MNKDMYNRIEDFLQDQSFINWVNQTTKDDIDFWEEWLRANPDKEDLLFDALAIAKGLRFRPVEMEAAKVEAALAKLNKTLDQRPVNRLRPRRTNRSFRRFWVIAATISLLVVSYFALNTYLKPQEVVHQTAYGEQLDLTLIDGTQVVLNAHSSLRYFPQQTREVWLEGEAFFKVEKKPVSSERFVVHTADLDVEVLGTSFNVNSLQGKTEVMLEEGKVKLNLKNGEEKTMEPGELISFSAKENKVLKKEKKVPSELHTSWKEGTLIFKEISLGEAMQKIETTYGVEVIFTEKTTEEKIISVAVPVTNLDICINAFQKSMGIEINKIDNRLIIK